MKRSIKRNAVLNAIKQICTIIFPIITIPYVTRVLQSDNYGKVNFCRSIISYFSLIASFGINNYAVRQGARIRDNKKRISKFANEVFTINCLFTVLSYLLLFISLAASAKLKQYTNIVLICSIGIALVTIGADWINTIYEDFQYITIRYIIFQLLSIILLFSIVKTKNDFIEYAFVTVFAGAGANILNIFYTRRYVKVRPTLHCNMREHIRPMFFLFVNSISVIIYVNSDITMLGYLSSDRSVGIYSVASKVYEIVKNLVAALIVTTVPRISILIEKRSRLEYKTLLKKIFSALLSILFPIIIGVLFMSKPIMGVVGGQDYISGYTALSILGIALLFSIVASFFTTCILLPNKMDKQNLLATTAAAIINIVLNLVIIPIFDFNGTALTTLLAELVVACIAIHYSDVKISDLIDKELIKSIFASSLSITVVCQMSTLLISNYFIRIIVAVLLSGLLFITINVHLKNPLILPVYEKLKGRINGNTRNRG